MPSNEKPDDNLNALDVTEPAPLARTEPEDAVRAELATAAQLNAGDLREKLSLWIAQRLALCGRETKLLSLLRQQVEDASHQRSAEAVTRYLAQAVHLRSQILELRSEPNDLTIEHAGDKK